MNKKNTKIIIKFKDRSFDVSYSINDNFKKFNMVEELTKYVWIWMNEYNEEFGYTMVYEI
jgi:hypothetical protein